jgi:hypothetical protein
MKHMAECFTAIRWLGVANAWATGKWSDRTPADYIQFYTDDVKGNPGGENLEYLIMFANETGRDLYLCTPITADDEYFAKLARLLKYGSDGKEPYSGPTKNPKYPPLNPNLRVYIEVGNEIWNWAFGSTQQGNQLANDQMKAGTGESAIFNYNKQGNYRSWHALRTVRASDAFRVVFGDTSLAGGMSEQIRFLIEFQYANAQETAWNSFRFLDGYFNNGDGEHVKTPHLPRYYVWGAGGAAYYGVGNGEGTQSEVVFQDPSFEKSIAADGTTDTNPKDSAWTFAGGAGIYRNLSSAVADFTPGKRVPQPQKTAAGFKFKTGAAPLYVYQLGRSYDEGSEGARIVILDAATNQLVAQSDTGPVQAYLTRVFGYYYGKPLAKPVELKADTSYYLLSADVRGRSMTFDDQTTATVSAGLVIEAAATATVAALDQPEGWKPQDLPGQAGHIDGAVTFLYSTRDDIKPTLPQPPAGQQAAILAAGGTISQSVNFPKTGQFALSFNAANSGQGGWPFRIFVDEQIATPRSQGDYRNTDGDAGLGGWGRNNGFKEEWGSAVFAIDKAGPHTIKLVSTAKDPKAYVVFDDLRIASCDAIMDSGFGSGQALGQPVENGWRQQNLTDSAFGMVFGLPRVAYESGWSLGGDFYQKPIQNYVKLKDLRARQINDTAIDIFSASGGTLNVWGVYTYWPVDDFKNGRDYPIMQSIIASSNHLPVEEDNGQKIPCRLDDKNRVKWSWNGALNAPGAWISWLVIAPESGSYEISVKAPAGDAATRYEVEVDGLLVGAGTAGTDAATFKTTLTRGSHGVRVRTRDGKLNLQEVNLAPVQ